MHQVFAQLHNPQPVQDLRGYITVAHPGTLNYVCPAGERGRY